jgi:hypothetical protein
VPTRSFRILCALFIIVLPFVPFSHVRFCFARSLSALASLTYGDMLCGPGLRQRCPSAGGAIAVPSLAGRRYPHHRAAVGGAAVAKHTARLPCNVSGISGVTSADLRRPHCR